MVGQLRSPAKLISDARAASQSEEEADDLVQFVGVVKEYAGTAAAGVVRALDGIDLAIGRNQLVCLIGPSGCGKTTLLNCLAGFVDVSQGTILVGGGQIDGPSWERGVVFQDYALFPWLTVKENVVFGPRARGARRSEQEEIAAKYLQMVGLDGFADRYPFELSGGMKQRVGLARTLANQPSILLMDEPFGALDALTRELMQDELLRIWLKERKTILFVTHSITEAVFLSDRVVVMTRRPGRICADVRIDLPRPRDRSAADFNVVAGHVRELVFSQLGGEVPA